MKTHERMQSIFSRDVFSWNAQGKAKFHGCVDNTHNNPTLDAHLDVIVQPDHNFCSLDTKSAPVVGDRGSQHTC